MATAPVKSQPLHNFSLPCLKWGHRTNHMNNNNHRFSRPPDSTAPPPPPPISEPDSDSESGSENLKKLKVGSRTTSRNLFSFSFCSSQQRPLSGVGGGGTESNEGGDTEREKRCDEVETEESAPKPWNLRPRKVVAAKMSTAVTAEIGGTSSWKNASNNGEFPETIPIINAIPPVENLPLPKSMRLRGQAEGHGSERREKRKFWISLSREEIEEDVYALTGSKPARKPKKRPRTVQKQVDNLLPGSYFAGVAIDSYRVYDALS